MKLATIKNNSRDGLLVGVNADLTKAVSLLPVASTLQMLLDNWDNLLPHVNAVAHDLANGSLKNTFDFDEKMCESPLPRAYQWADGSAYVNHVELARRARGVPMPASFWTDPLIYQGGSDSFLAPYDDIAVDSEEYGVDMEAEVAVIVGDVPMNATPEEAYHAIKLIMLVNDISLRELIPAELAKGFGFFQSKPSSAFSPIAVTPDELGTAWHDGKLHLPLVTVLNNKELGRPNAGIDMTFNFPAIIAHAAKTRPLCAGTIIGSGTVSNIDRRVGSSCLMEKRMIEIIEGGNAVTPYLKFGDTLKIAMFSNEGANIFGTINQTVVKKGKRKDRFF
jgi:fumarylacetoacetate (FAA) hydrolase